MEQVSPGECGRLVRTGTVLYHLLNLLCFLSFQGAGFPQRHGCHWSRPSEVRTLLVGSPVQALLPTQSGEPLWLEQREDCLKPHPQTTGALSLRPGDSKPLARVPDRHKAFLVTSQEELHPGPFPDSSPGPFILQGHEIFGGWGAHGENKAI